MLVEISEEEAAMLAVWRQLDGDVRQHLNVTAQALAGPQACSIMPPMQALPRLRRAYWAMRAMRSPIIKLHGPIALN